MSNDLPHPPPVIAKGLKLVKCACGHELDTMFGFIEPRPGRWAMCIDCFRLYQLDDKLQLVLVPNAVLSVLSADALAAIEDMKNYIKECRNSYRDGDDWE